jgi:hypothetical protein
LKILPETILAPAGRGTSVQVPLSIRALNSFCIVARKCRLTKALRWSVGIDEMTALVVAERFSQSASLRVTPVACRVTIA